MPQQIDDLCKAESKLSTQLAVAFFIVLVIVGLVAWLLSANDVLSIGWIVGGSAVTIITSMFIMMWWSSISEKNVKKQLSDLSISESICRANYKVGDTIEKRYITQNK